MKSTTPTSTGPQSAIVVSRVLDFSGFGENEKNGVVVVVVSWKSVGNFGIWDWER